MSQFVVPQFIDVEDKILGPVTTRQFAIMMVDALVMFIVYKLLSLPIAIITDVVLLVSGLVLSFVRINGQPFHFFLLNVTQTWKRPRVRVWNKTMSDAEE